MIDINFYHIDVEKNEVGIDVNRGFKFLLYHKDHDTVKTSYNIDSFKSLIGFLAESVEEVRTIFGIPEEAREVSDEDL